jgi:hypothetical protein
MALWVWLGGKLPDTITIFSNSHYRAPVFGRIIQVFNRQIGPRNLMRIGKLVIANPLWTACQLACLPPDEFNKAVGLSRFITFLHHFNVAPSDCAGLLNANPRWPGHAYGEKLIATLEKAGMREMKICGE